MTLAPAPLRTDRPDQLERALQRAKPLVRQAIQLQQAARRRGDLRECPCCGWTFDTFLLQGNEPDARCPRCDSLVRNRLIWVYLHREGLLRPGARILHMAAEPALWRRLRRRTDVAYVTGDIRPGSRTSHVFDLTDAPFRDGTFDVVLVAHVLEHIPDDRAAMGEIRRLLAPGGVALLQHPTDAGLAAVKEDPAVVAPADRTREYGQWDHVRSYSPGGLRERLEASGLQVDVVDYAAELATSVVERHGLRNASDGTPQYDNDLIFVCR